MEEYVYVCGWEKSDGQIRVWLKESPFSKATGETVTLAVENLIKSVHNDGGAVTPFFEFTPPLPKSESVEQYYHPELFLICGDDRFEPDEPRVRAFAPPEERASSNTWYEKFFDGGGCRVCRTPKGRRNNRPLFIKHASRDGGFAGLGSLTVQFYSADFRALLTREENERVQFQAVERPPGNRKQYFELVGHPGVPTIAVKGIKPDGWQCPECGHRFFCYFNSKLSCRAFVVRDTLPSPLPDLFTIENTGSVELCVTAERWSRMVGQRGTRGILSSPLGVIGKEQVDCQPELKVREQ